MTAVQFCPVPATQHITNSITRSLQLHLSMMLVQEDVEQFLQHGAKSNRTNSMINQTHFKIVWSALNDQQLSGSCICYHSKQSLHLTTQEQK